MRMWTSSTYRCSSQPPSLTSQLTTHTSADALMDNKSNKPWNNADVASESWKVCLFSNGWDRLLKGPIIVQNAAIRQKKTTTNRDKLLHKSITMISLYQCFDFSMRTFVYCVICLIVNCKQGLWTMHRHTIFLEMHNSLLKILKPRVFASIARTFLGAEALTVTSCDLEPIRWAALRTPRQPLSQHASLQVRSHSSSSSSSL